MSVAFALVAGACQGSPAADPSRGEPASQPAKSTAEPSATPTKSEAEKPATAALPEAAPKTDTAASSDKPAAPSTPESATKSSKSPLPFPLEKAGMSPMPASALRTRLEAVQKKLDVDKVWDDEATPEQLIAVLPMKVGEFMSPSLPDTSAQGAGVPGRAVIRDYLHNETTVHAIIYDAGKAPDARRVFSEYLLLVGDERQGQQHPFITRGGVPGMEAFTPSMQLSFATALVNKRHMLVIVARPTDDPNAARKFLEALDYSPLP